MARPVGTPNRATVVLQEIADKMGINPFEELLKFSMGDYSPEIRFKATSEACQYIYAKKRAVEMKVELTEDEKKIDQMSYDEFMNVVTKYADKKAN